MNMAKWREKTGNTVTGPEQESERESAPETAAPGHAGRRRLGRRHRDGDNVRAGVKRISGAAATLVTIIAMIICVLLALHIAFVVFAANHDNSIVGTVNDWADWFAWRFRDMFVPKDQRVGVLVNYGIAAVVYLIAGRVAAGVIRRIR
jgi:hypothetical protein